MKRIQFFVMMMVLCLVVPDLFGQFTTNAKSEVKLDGGKVIQFAGNVSGTDTLNSAVFDLSEFDGNLTSYPLQGWALLTGGTASTRKVSVEVWGGFGNSLKCVDTLLYKDSVTTLIDKTLDLNGKRPVRTYLKVFGTSGNSATGTGFSFVVYGYKKE